MTAGIGERPEEFAAMEEALADPWWITETHRPLVDQMLARQKQLERTLALAPVVVEQLVWADAFINGDHDICEMCEAFVPFRTALANLDAALGGDATDQTAD